MQRIIDAPQVSASPFELLDESRKPLVLVVDPDASARSVLEVVLVRDGFDVWSTGSGEEGLRLLKTRTPDVIVLESDLGGEDGFSFVSQVRGDAKTAGTPVLLLARHDDQNVADMAEVVGVDDFIQKPAYARDVSALVNLELAKVRGTGDIAFQSGQVDPAHLLRAILSCPRSGKLLLASGKAQISFQEGFVVAARFGKSFGVDALVRALALTHGEYSLTFEPVPSSSFRCSLKELVQLVFPRVHEWQHMLLRSVPLEAKLAVDFVRLAQARATMPDEVNRIVQLFDGRRTVRQVLLDSTVDESLTLEIATRLFLMAVVAPVEKEPSSSDVVVPKRAPKFFEPDDTRAPRYESDETQDGGWQAGSLGEHSQLADLAPDVVKQIDAFNIQIEVEPRQMKPGERALREFTAQQLKPLLLVDVAVAKARAQETATVSALSPTLSVEPQPETPVARAFDPQSRIATPAMTPVVAEAADALEASFFAASTVDDHVEAGRAAVEDEDTARRRRPIANPFVIGAVLAALVLVVAISFEFATKRGAVASAREVEAVKPTDTQPPAVALVAAPVVVPDIEEPEFIEDDAPPTVIDVSGPLRDAKTLYERGAYPKAISMLEQVVADEPGSVQGWLLLGLARYDSNNAKLAREAAEKVLALDPNNAGVQMLLATLSFDVGDKVGAKEALQKYLTLEPNGSSAAEARALLAR